MEPGVAGVESGDGGHVDPQFVVLATAGRCGSTLLRLMLDAHPEIGCPGEANLPSLLGTLGLAWHTMLRDTEPLKEVETMPEVARQSMRRALGDIMRHYCVRYGKRVYVDKSLTSVQWLAAVRDVFPDTRFVFLYRHVLDVVMSGIEASPWGFAGFGYAPFVSKSVDNFVAPLVQHWNTQVRPAIEWAAAYPESSLQVRYEQLVRHPERQFERICRFLGVEVLAGLPLQAFEIGRRSGTPGDSKVAFTNEVHQESVGRGRQVPLGLIPDPLVREMNRNLRALGYPAVRGAATQERRARTRLRAARAPRALVAEVLANMPQSIEVQSGELHGLRKFALRADDASSLRWVFDLQTGSVERSRSLADLELEGSCADLVALLRDGVNSATLINRGRLRCRAGAPDKDGAAVSQSSTEIRVRVASGVLRDAVNRRNSEGSSGLRRLPGCTPRARL